MRSPFHVVLKTKVVSGASEAAAITSAAERLEMAVAEMTICRMSLDSFMDGVLVIGKRRAL
jgi:hypothetical protein